MIMQVILNDYAGYQRVNSDPYADILSSALNMDFDAEICISIRPIGLLYRTKLVIMLWWARTRKDQFLER